MSNVVLSAREPLSDRIATLRACKDVGLARRLCADDAQPIGLREEALYLLDGSSELDFALSLACCIPKAAPTLREAGIEVAKQLVRPNYLPILEVALKSNLETFVVQAIWGLCCTKAENRLAVSVERVSLELVDVLASLATVDYLDPSVPKEQLLGSYRAEALSALCLRDLGWLVDDDWFTTALEDFSTYSIRALAVNTMLREAPRKQPGKIVTVIANSLCSGIESNPKLCNWSEEWYYGSTLDTDERAQAVQIMSLAYAAEARWLLRASTNLLRKGPTLAENDLKLVILCLAAWTAEKPESGIVLPWITRECASAARESLLLILAKHPSVEFDLSDIRKQLSASKWKTHWVLAAGVLSVCLAKEFSLSNVEDDLIPTILPIADELDPRLAEPAWGVITSNLQDIPDRSLTLVLRAIERSMVTRHVGVYKKLMEILRITLCTERPAIEASELDHFLQRLSQDLIYLASSETAEVFSIAVHGFFTHGIKRNGLYNVRLMTSLLNIADIGSTKRRTAEPSLALLNAVLDACAIRAGAHRGRIVKIYLQLAASLSEGEDIKLKASFRNFCKICNAHQQWIDETLQLVIGINASVASRLSG